MPIVDFLPVATGGGANVESQASFVADAQTAAGFTAGSTADSSKANKQWRQSSFVTAAIANFISQVLSISVLDDGNLANFINNFKAAITSWVASAFGVSIGNPGYIKFPGGLTIQWAIGPTDPANSSQPSHVVNWAIPFPTACLVAYVTTDLSNTTGGQDNFYQTAGWSVNSVTVQRQNYGSGSGDYSGATTRSIVLGIGY